MDGYRYAANCLPEKALVSSISRLFYNVALNNNYFVKRVLYLTYDGLTDPLGQSQILPYLKGLSLYGYQFTVLSFEKKDRFQKEKKIIDKLAKESGIEWVVLSFSSKPPFFSKFYDAVRMRRKSIKLHKQKHFDMVHCRSYIAADVGLFLKKKFGVKFFFDMRGFWADEKKDGSWNISNPIFRSIYKYYKFKESQYLAYADHIISLTEAGKKEMMSWPAYNKNIPISVIPCCTDMTLFSLTDANQKKQSREELGFSQNALVISYLGSVGTWYMLDEMLLFFRQIKKTYPQAHFLFVTHSDREMIGKRAAQTGVQARDLTIMQVPRSKVPYVIKSSDINISFIRPVYSKISSSPTKLGEVLSMGIPVICNSGVGDVKHIVEATQSGFILDGFTEKNFHGAILIVPALLKKSPVLIRDAAKKIYDLGRGIESYAESYKAVLL